MAGAAALARIEQRPRPKVHTSHDAIRSQGETSIHHFRYHLYTTVLFTLYYSCMSDIQSFTELTHSLCEGCP